MSEPPADQKPCFVAGRGLKRGSYIRSHDGDRQLTTYEVHVLMTSRERPKDDRRSARSGKPRVWTATPNVSNRRLAFEPADLV